MSTYACPGPACQCCSIGVQLMGSIVQERLTNLKEHRDFEKLYEIITRRIAEQPLPSDRPVRSPALQESRLS